MLSKRDLILLSITIGLGIWILDIYVDSILFFKGSFEDSLIPHIFGKVFYFHALLFICFVFFVLVIARYLGKFRKTEEKLKALENKYEVQFNNALDGIVICNAESGIISDCNDAILKMTGREREELIGKHQSILHPPEAIEDGFTKTYKQHLHEKEGDTLDELIIAKDGSIKDVAIKANTFEFQGENSIQGIFRDITEQKMAEDALRESEMKFRGLVETTSDWIWEVDEKACYTYASSKVFDILGYEPEYILGKTPFDLMPQNEATRVKNIFGPIVASQKPFIELENINLHKDGHEVTLETSGIPLFNSKGEFCGYRGIDRDITDRKKAEQALLHSEVQRKETNKIMSAVLNRTHIMAVLLDTDFNFIWVNKAYADTCNHDISFFPGKNHFALYPHEENQTIFQRVVDTGEPFFIIAKPFEFPDQPERGVTYWDWSLQPVKDKSEKITSLVFTLTEVTERKLAEEKLKESEDKFRKLFETSADGVMIIDAEDRMIIDINKACERLYGYTKEEFLKLKLTDVSNEPEKSEQAIKPTLYGELTNIPIRYHIKKDGTVFPIEVSVGNFSIKGKKIVYGIIRDITERKIAEEKLRNAETRLKNTFNISPGLISAVDINTGYFTYCNPAVTKILGFSVEEFTSRPFMELLHPDDRQRTVDEVASQLIGNPVANFENRYLCKDGSYNGWDGRQLRQIKMEWCMVLQQISPSARRQRRNFKKAKSDWRQYWRQQEKGSG